MQNRTPGPVLRILREEAAASFLDVRDIRRPGVKGSRVEAACKRRVVVRLRGLGFSFPEVARFMGGVHHTAVMYLARTAGRVRRDEFPERKRD